MNFEENLGEKLYANSAECLLKRFALSRHAENGAFAECHYPSTEEGRPASGSIYYYIAPNEYTKFHEIDCDEYWCYHAGSTAELWVISPEGELTITNVGVGENAVPMLYIQKGSIFGARHAEDEVEGTLFSCITVPRYMDGVSLQLFEKEEMLSKYPNTAAFWD